MTSKISLSKLSGAILLTTTLLVIVCGQSRIYGDVKKTFTKQLLEQFGNGSTISERDLEHFYSTKQISWKHSLAPRRSLSECFADFSSGSSQGQQSCLLKQCLSPGEVFQLSGLLASTTDDGVCTMSMILLHMIENKTCASNQLTTFHNQASRDRSPSTVETWGYGILCTSLIVLAALTGFLVLPFVRGINYQRTIIYMVGLAVGSLAGSSLLFLAPEALELTEQEMNENSYVWKCLVMVVAIYAFFLIERVLKIVTDWRKHKTQKKSKQRASNGVSFISLTLENRKVSNYTDLELSPQQLPTCTENVNVSRDSGIDHLHETTENAKENGLKNDVSTVMSKEQTRETGTEGDQEKPHVEPVAWMIICGDALHNFIDGVSIGAAFTESVLAGVSVSVAVFCEELPHELGDFAVLLSSGMKKKKAVLWNFLSACSIYVGLVIGIFLGENAEAHTWVFAFAGGMFLYIALVDMMPAMTHAGEIEENKRLIGTANIFILQNAGMLTGFSVMLILAIYGGNLETAIRDGT